jgi:hypothetical protein
MHTRAVYLNGPEDLHLDTLALKAPAFRHFDRYRKTLLVR